MRSFTDPSYRIQQYYIYCANKGFTMDEDIEYGFTISRLSERLGIPLNVVRRDMAALFVMPESGYLYFDDADQFDDLDKEELRKYIITGTTDDIPIVSAMPFLYAQAEIPFATKNDEATIITAYSGIKLREPKDTDYLIKNSYRFRETQGLIDHIQVLDKAIRLSCSATIRYFDPLEKHTITIEIYPVRLLYDSTDNIYAVVAAFENFTHLYTYRLDRMKAAAANEHRTWDIHDKKYKPLLEKLAFEPYVWDRNFDNIELESVKVYFQNSGNVWTKVRKDLACRTKGKLYEEVSNIFGETAPVLVYEDKVSGMKSFMQWIAGYGRSAYVCEPETLLQDIVYSLRKQLDNYI